MSTAKEALNQSVMAVSSSPEAVKAVGILGTIGNGFLWAADHANALVALTTLLISLVMFYYTRKKMKIEIELAKINVELARAHKQEVDNEHN